MLAKAKKEASLRVYLGSSNSIKSVFNNHSELLYFMNSVYAAPVFNDVQTLNKFLAICSGLSPVQMSHIICQGKLVLTQGMLSKCTLKQGDKTVYLAHTLKLIVKNIDPWETNIYDLIKGEMKLNADTKYFVLEVKFNYLPPPGKNAVPMEERC